MDTIIYCTGYHYSLPFLNPALGIYIDTRRVFPLYKHMFAPAIGPDLAFVGIPYQVLPFPLLEYQSKYLARIMSGRFRLPSKEKMEEDIAQYEKMLLKTGFNTW